MIVIKNKQAIQKMMTAGSLLAHIFDELSAIIVSGISTLDIDAWIARQLKEHNLTSRSLGYRGYRHVSCISVNDEVIHGIPSRETVVQEHDLVKVDVCASWKDYCADMARTFVVRAAEQETGRGAAASHQQLVYAAQAALDKGIEQAVPGNRLSDISAAIQQEVERHGYNVVRDFAGHGIGKRMHEEPEIVNFGLPGSGPVVRAGMAFALEPMIMMGKHDVYVADDGWTVKTVDQSLAAHVEDTVVVTDNGPYITTRLAGVPASDIHVHRLQVQGELK